MIETARLRLEGDLAEVALGDAAALKRVYDATAAKLYGICRRILSEESTAEDALQEVYLKIWHHAARFDASIASPITWMCTIARNTALDARRAHQRWDGAERASGNIDRDDQSSASDPFAIDAHAVERCLDTLDTNQRTAIVAAFYEGFSYSELAVSRAVPLGTMKSWIRRGLALLKGCLDDE